MKKIYEKIKENNPAIIISDLRDEEYGQWHFMAIDPNDILLDIIEYISPSEAFRENYAD